MTVFSIGSPSAALAGGLLIGVAASLLLLVQGRIAGISGILGEIVTGQAGRRGWRLWFVLGLLAAWPLWTVATGAAPQGRLQSPLPLLIVAGLLVGFGSVLGSGCTSGHGVCGLGNLSRRSLVAVAVFMATGMATVYVVRHVAE